MGLEMKEEVANPLATMPQNVDVLDKPKESPYPPQMRYCNPVERDPKKAGAKENHFYVHAEGYKEMRVICNLEKPYTVSVIASRNMSKYTKPDGTVERAYKSGPSHSLYEQHTIARKDEKCMKNGKEVPAVETGHAYVLALFLEDGTSMMVIYEALKLMADYVYPVFGAGSAHKGQGVRIEIANHSANETTSKKGNVYLKPTLFTQYKQVDLTKAQTEMVGQMYQSRKKFVDEFLTK